MVRSCLLKSETFPQAELPTLDDYLELTYCLNHQKKYSKVKSNPPLLVFHHPLLQLKPKFYQTSLLSLEKSA